MRTLAVRKIPAHLRRLGVCLISLSTLLVAAMLLQEPAHAGESFTWTGEGQDGVWTNSCNWHPKNHCQPTYPGKEAADDQAVVARTPSAPAHVTLGEDIDLKSLTLGEGASLTGGSVAVSGSFGWSGGDLDTELILPPGSSGAIDGAHSKTLEGVIFNQGDLSLGSVLLNMQQGAEINNAGTFTVAPGGRIQGLNCCLNPPEINNQDGRFSVGSLLPVPGVDTVTVQDVAFNVSAGGIVDVTKGVLELRKGLGEIDDGTSFTGEGKVRITDRARLNMAGTFDVSPTTAIELDSCSGQCGWGTLTGTGTMEGDGVFLWSGGSVDGELTLGSQIDTFMSGPAVKELKGKIVNNGKVTLQASASATPAGEFRFGQASRFNNNDVFIAHERTSIRGAVCCNTDVVATFDNTGKFSVSSTNNITPGTTTLSAVAFRAGGEVNVERGTLELRKGRGTLLAGLNVTGKGTVTAMDGQFLEMSGAFNVAPGATLELSSVSGDSGQGSLGGRGSLGGGGLFLWTGGYVGHGAHLVIAEDSSMQLEASAIKELYGAVTNKGHATIVADPPPAPAAGPLKFYGSATFVNEGSFHASDRSVLFGNACCNDPATFVNEGTFDMSAPFNTNAGTITFDAMYFWNSGEVELETGKLLIGRLGGYEQSAGSTRLMGGSLEAGSHVYISGGSLEGTGTITGQVANFKGIVAPGDPETPDSTGILKIDGDYHQKTEGILNADLRGTTPGRGFDQLQITGRSELAGTLDLDTARRFSPDKSTKLRVLTTAGQRSGTFGLLKDTRLPRGREWHALYRPLDVTLGVRRAG